MKRFVGAAPMTRLKVVVKGDDSGQKKLPSETSGSA
jgi:hypothetical protein